MERQKRSFMAKYSDGTGYTISLSTTPIVVWDLAEFVSGTNGISWFREGVSSTKEGYATVLGAGMYDITMLVEGQGGAAVDITLGLYKEFASVSTLIGSSVVEIISATTGIDSIWTVKAVAYLEKGTIIRGKLSVASSTATFTVHNSTLTIVEV
jgi:hypothetical protein